MKKIAITLLALLAFSIQGMAQKYLDIYQNGVVTKSISAADIDSVSITESQPRIIKIWRDGNAIFTYFSTDIDCIKVSREGDEPLVYLGVVGFNQELYTKPIDILATSTATQYKAFIDGLSRKDGTLLYYAVDNALDMLENQQIETPVNSVNLVTFTDGIDQGSMMMSSKYGSSKEYLTALSKRIAETKIKGLPINAFSVGLRGNDVVDNLIFKNNLTQLASSKDKAFEVNNMDDVHSRLQAIADQIISISTRQTVSVKIPGTDSGTLIRFTFDGLPANESQLYIEGTFNLQDRSLHNVSYHGIKANSGNIVQGTQNGIFITYTFTGLQREDENGLIPTNDIRQYYRMSSSPIWQVNSEFSPANNTQRNISHSGSAIVLALDCSNSLGDQFANMKSYAQNFIDQVANCAQPFNLSAPANPNAEIVVENGKFVVNLNWDKVKYSESYAIYTDYDYRYGNFGATKIDNLKTTAWKDDNPSWNKTYYIEASGHGLKNYTSIEIGYPLSKPQNVKAEVMANQFGIQISWNPVKYAQSYKIYRKDNNSGYYLIADNIFSTSYIDEPPLGKYSTYKVVAVGYGLESEESNYTESVYFSLESPQNFKAVLDNNRFAVYLTWDAVKFAESYNIYRGSTKIASNITSTYYTDEPTSTGNVYYYVSAVRENYESTKSSATGNISISLAPPANVTATMDVNSFAVNLSWDAVNRAEKYDVYRSSSSSGSYTKMAEGISSTTWVDESPLSGNNYYKVKAISAKIESSYSNYAYILVEYKLEAPTNVTAIFDENLFTVNLNWNAVPRAESYTIYRNSSKIGEGITSTSWTDNTPVAGNNTYSIYAIGHGLTSTSSPSVTYNHVLNAPQNVRATLDDEKLFINLSWDAVKYAESYTIYRNSNSTGTFTQVANGITTTSWIDKTPLAGNNYYKVYATGHGLTSPESRTTNVIKVDYTPDTPKNVTAVLDDDDFVIKVSWSAAKHADSYAVYRSGDSNGPFTMVADNISSTTWTDSSPLAGSNYYQVYAIGHGYTSESSSTTNAVNYALDAPTNVNAIMDDEDFVINVSWNAVKYAEYYVVYKSNNPTENFTKVADNITLTIWKDNSPLAGNNYYKVYAIGHGYTSAESSTTDAVNCVLDAPTKAKAVLDSENFVVEVSWDAVKYAESYAVYRSNNSAETLTKVADNIYSTTWVDNSPLTGKNYYKICAIGHGQTSSNSSATNYIVVKRPDGIIKVNGVTFKMIKVIGGTFQMGSTSGDIDEKPVHSVTLSDYSLCETEVTNSLWKAVMGNLPSSSSTYYSYGNFPATMISWYDCQTFITRLNALTGLAFRLPTEAEWEFAATGGSSWYANNSDKKPHAVATLTPNNLGLYDMLGNVYEWCQDWYGSYDSSPKTNPTGPSSGEYRVCRGGSYTSTLYYCRKTSRRNFNPTIELAYLGFRLAL